MERTYAEGEQVVASGVIDALAGGDGESVGRYLEDVTTVKGLHSEGVIGEGEELLFHNERGGVFGDEGRKDGNRSTDSG
jgi:hypothetical protein